jgi:NADH:ubiquinone oxidoreductase subunit 5 (subunit L)/multisubunit Na+/H+ antiporter MnhA subunit
MILNRVGDLGLAFGIFLIFFYFKSVDFSVVFTLVPYFSKINIIFLSVEFPVIELVSFFLFFGVVGKSAQFGLHA